MSPRFSRTSGKKAQRKSSCLATTLPGVTSTFASRPLGTAGIAERGCPPFAGLSSSIMALSSTAFGNPSSGTAAHSSAGSSLNPAHAQLAAELCGFPLAKTPERVTFSNSHEGTPQASNALLQA